MKHIFFFLLFATIAQAQDAANLPLQEVTFGDNIKTVKISLQGLPLSMPLIEMSNSGKIELSWDDLDADLKAYSYKVIYCNADWTPNTLLTEMDYVNGYTYDIVRDYRTSSRSFTNYIHYNVVVPNDNTKLLKTGNYILKIYTDGEESNVVLTRRFMVVEPKARITAQMQMPAGARLRSHHELNFTLDYKGYNIRSPEAEVKAIVLQNSRWDNAITDLQPTFQRENQLLYDFKGKITFLAGKEFRRLDLTTTRYQTEGVDYYDYHDKKFDAYPFPTVPLRDMAYQSWFDANGKFVTMMKDSDEPNFQGDYINMHFQLPLPGEINGASVYVFGGFNNYLCDNSNRMKYNTITHQYEAEIRLKQGFYNYQFAVVKDGETTVNTSHIEGDWYETENDYTVLVYHRPFGARHDALISAYTLNSVK
jgi:hypothetical protein